MENIRLGDIAHVRSGYHFRASFNPTQEEGVQILQMGDLDVNGNLIRPLKRANIDRISNDHVLQSGDILLRARGDNFRTFLVDDSLIGFVLAAPLLRVRVHRKDVAAAYLSWYLNQQRVKRQLYVGTCGTASKMIHIKFLEEVEISVPSTETQFAIANIVSLSEKEFRLLEILRKTRAKLIQAQLTNLF